MSYPLYPVICRHSVRNSGVIYATCIFHQDLSPSLTIWPNGGFKCHGCQKTGRVDDHPELRMIFDRVHFRWLEEAGQLRLPGF